VTFVYSGKPYVLQFVDGNLSGLEIKTRPMAFSEVVDVLDYESAMREAENLREIRTVVMSGEKGGLLGEFTSRIVYCNGELVEYRKFLEGFDFDDLMAVLNAWIRAISGQDRPLSEAQKMEQEEELQLPEA
jgi:hypothetical protein